MQRPESSEEMLFQLWFAVVGSNGEGLCSRVKNIEEHQKKYAESDRKNTCYYLHDKEEGRTRTGKLVDMAKWGISEGVKIGAALGIFTWLRGQL